MCEQLLEGVVYPLAVKAHNVLDLVHQKERVTLVVQLDLVLPLS